MTDSPAPRSAPSAASSAPVSPASRTPRSSSAPGSRCAGSPCPSCRPGRRTGAHPAGVRPPPHARADDEDRVGALAGRARARLRRQLRRQPRARRTPCRRCCGRWSRCWSAPARSSSGPTTTSARCRRTPRATSPAGTPRCGRSRSDLPVGRARRGSARRRLGRPRQRPRDVTMGDHDVELVGVDDPHIGYDRYAAVSGPGRRRRRADDGSGPRALPARARRDGRRRRLGRARGAHPRRAARPAGLGRPRHQLRPRHPPRQGCLPVVARRRPRRPRRRGGAGRPAPSRMPPGCTSRPGSGTSPYAPVRFACRPEATLLTLVARDA